MMAVLHEQTYFSDGARIRDDTLKPFEPSEIGDITGQRVCHLQCHLGGDSLSLARMGATVVGVDCSTVAIDQARARADSEGLADRVSFVCATVDDAVHQTAGPFDGDYTDAGAMFEHPESWQWNHAVGEVVTALANAGMRIETVAWHLGDEENLQLQVDGLWTVPGSTLPLSFSLRATKR